MTPKRLDACEIDLRESNSRWWVDEYADELIAEAREAQRLRKAIKAAVEDGDIDGLLEINAAAAATEGR